MSTRRALAAATLTLALVAGPGSALAAACPRTSLPEIENGVMCPVCKTPLGLAQESPQANRERAFIRERIDRCQSKRQIKAALAAEFGDEVLALPQRRGFDLAAYLVPVAALLLGLAAAAFATVRWRRRRPPPAGAAAPVPARSVEEPGVDHGGGPARRSRATASAAERLERELERYDA